MKKKGIVIASAVAMTLALGACADKKPPMGSSSCKSSSCSGKMGGSSCKANSCSGKMGGSSCKSH